MKILFFGSKHTQTERMRNRDNSCVRHPHDVVSNIVKGPRKRQEVRLNKKSKRNSMTKTTLKRKYLSASKIWFVCFSTAKRNTNQINAPELFDV